MPGIPICIYLQNISMFRVILSRGKALQSGGFGVALPYEMTGITSADDEAAIHQKYGVTDESRGSSVDYLFIEEVIFLHQKGLLQAFRNSQDSQPLEAPDLFDILQEQDVPLVSYLVFAHMRSQSFIVKRRCDRVIRCRADIAKYDDNFSPEENAKLELRRRTFYSKNPSVIHWEDDSIVPSEDGSSLIAFDVYNPNSAFRKTDPGPPDFHVAVAYFGAPAPHFDTFLNVLKDSDGVPLKIATVADGGQVLMFSMTNGDVPDLTNRTNVVEGENNIMIDKER